MRGSGTRTFGRAALAALVALGATGLLAVACSGVTSPTGQSHLKLLLTDAPAGVDEVNIYFTSVTVKPVGRPVEELDLELEVNPIDLLTLSDSVTAFAAGAVPPGEYEFIHINIDQDRSSLVENGVEKTLQVPSEEIKIVGGFTVADDQTTTLTLDFDADASLIQLGHGDWLLKPIVIISRNETSSEG